MTRRLASLLGRHGGDYGTKYIQVLHYGIWLWRRILNGACISISNLPENIAWQTHKDYFRSEARGPLKSGAWGGRPTCHPQTPPVLTHVVHEATVCCNPHNSSNWDSCFPRQFGYKHTFCQDVSTKVCPSLYICKNITCLNIGLLRSRQVVSILCKIVYW
jgi:hypothetical protein